MAQIKQTITRSDSTGPWIFSQAPYAEAVCTEEEMNEIILPYRAATGALIGLTGSTLSEVSDTVMDLTYDFDTDTNRDRALEYFRRETSRKKDLFTAKRLEANVTYTVVTTLS
jgi:hypothetical protein